MDVKRVTDEIRGNSRASRPGLDWLLRIVFVELVDLFEEFPLDERSFFEGACHGSLFLFAALDDKGVALLVFASCLESLGELTPGAHRMMASAPTLTLALTAAHRVVDRVHSHAARLRTDAQPTGTTGLAAYDVHVFNVADLSNRRVALLVNPAKFTGGQFEQCVSALTVADDGLGTRASDNLTASAWCQLDIVKCKPKGNSL